MRSWMDFGCVLGSFLDVAFGADGSLKKSDSKIGCVLGSFLDVVFKKSDALLDSFLDVVFNKKMRSWPFCLSARPPPPSPPPPAPFPSPTPPHWPPFLAPLFPAHSSAPPPTPSPSPPSPASTPPLPSHSPLCPARPTDPRPPPPFRLIDMKNQYFEFWVSRAGRRARPNWCLARPWRSWRALGIGFTGSREWV